MNKKTLIVEIGKILVNLILLPLYFIKFFHYQAVYDGGVTADYYYNMYQNVSRDGVTALIWLAFVVMALSIVFSALTIAKGNKNIKVASHIAICLSIVLFIILLFIAASSHVYY